MADAPGPGIADITSALRRRAWIIVLCVATLAPLSVGVAYVLPPVYSAQAKILIEGQQIPDELARSTVTASAAERIELIKQRLLTRQNLLVLINDLNLYDDFDNMSLSDKIERARKATSFESIDFGGRNYRGPAQVSAFTIKFEANTPVAAAAAANQFVTMALDQNAQSRTERATNTVDFFDQEVDRLSAQILDVEQQIVNFKLEKAGALPDSLSFRRDELLSLEQQAFSRDQRRIELQEQKGELELQLEQSGLQPAARLSPQERQIADLRNTLAQQSAVLAASHPQIRALEAKIAALEAGAAIGSPADGEQVSTSVEFDRRRLRRQIELVEGQLKLVDERQEADDARRQQMRLSISETPEVEIALNSLNRRFAGLQARYSEATKKQSEAKTGEKLEVNRQAERFVVIEQAQVPPDPDSPNRMLIAAGGGGVSLALGFGLVILLELLNNSIRTANDLQRRVQLRPIVTVPYIQTRSEIRRRRLLIAVVVLILAVGVPALLFAIDQYYLPLEVLAERFLTTTGLEDVIEMIERRF